MNVTSIQVIRRWGEGTVLPSGVQLAKYEHLELTLTVAPDEGQDADDGVKAAIVFTDAQCRKAGAKIAVSSAKPEAIAEKSPTAPPLASKGAKSDKSDPKPTTSTSEIAKADGGGTEQPPFGPGRDVAAEPKKKRKRGRPANPNKDAAKLLKGIEKVTTVQDCANRFDAMRVFADRTPGTGWETWEPLFRQLADHVKSIPDYQNQTGFEQFDLAMKAELQAKQVAEAGV